jgi:periplasmic divalent cation tolerance protein
VEEADKAAFVAKTTAERFKALRARIRALHSLPAIVVLPAATGEAEFLAWVREATRSLLSPAPRTSR